MVQISGLWCRLESTLGICYNNEKEIRYWEGYITDQSAELIQFFFTNFIILGGTAFVAFFIVHDSLKAARWKVYTGTFIFTLLYALLSTLFDAAYLQGLTSLGNILFYVHPVFAIIGGAVLYFMFVCEARDKLAFILLYPPLAYMLRRFWLIIRDIENTKWLRFCPLPVMFIGLSFLLRSAFK